MRNRWEILADLINKNNYKSIAEIGVSSGITSEYLLKNCKLEKYYLVDPDPSGVIRYNILKVYKPVPIFINLPSYDASKGISGYLDLVFIDGDHGYPAVKQDITTWLPRIHPGGIICGHDYDPHSPGVINAVKECFNEKNIKVFLEHDADMDKYERSEMAVWWVEKNWW